jgi:hypothetical protein
VSLNVEEVGAAKLSVLKDTDEPLAFNDVEAIRFTRCVRYLRWVF